MSATDQTDLNNLSAIDRRFKLSRACDRCRRRRIKCDEGHPCKSCSSSHSPCTFEEMGKKSLPHKSKRSTLEERMQQIEAFIHALPAGIFAPGTAGNPDELGSVPSVPAGPDPMIGVPPPSLSSRSLVNPSRFFPPMSAASLRSNTFEELSHFQSQQHASPVPLASSYLYLDDQGATRWQGEMSGFPLLDILIEREAGSPRPSTDSPASVRQASPTIAASEGESCSPAQNEWFPDRQRVQDPVRPEDVWMMIAAVIPPDLMDNLVLLWLRTTYYLMPFIHVPSFLADYPNPHKWDSGFGSFIVAVCCLASRHVDDVRVRSDSGDAFSAGAQYFDLFLRLRSLPGAERPTLYTVQAVLMAAVYAIGRGRLSKGLALLSESITLCLDAGLHRSVEQYDHFDPIETELRKRTFWTVYAWDKQAAVYFGRPPMIRLRDCDVPEPLFVDDEYITKDGIGAQPPGKVPLMSAFVATNRLYVIVEAILDVHPIPRPSGASQDFLSRATSALSGFRQSKDLKEAEALVDDWCQLLPEYWTVNVATMASRDVIRITQAERLHCLEHFARMLIHRYRFACHVASPTPGNEQAKEVAMRGAQRSALQIIAKHLEISSLGLMTYYGLFVIHQLTQAGRTLVAVLLDCKNDNSFMTSSLEALKACVGLLRRFSGRYVCGLRSADLLEETCRLNRISLEGLEKPIPTSFRPAWLRPVRKRTVKSAATDTDGSPHMSQQQPDNAFLRDLFEAPGNPNGHAGLSNGMSPPGYNPQLLPATGGPGLVGPLTRGSLAPLTADMFGNEDVSDLLAYLGGAVPETPTAMNYTLLGAATPSLLQAAATPLAPFGSDIQMTTPTSLVNGSGNSPVLMS